MMRRQKIWMGLVYMALSGAVGGCGEESNTSVVNGPSEEAMRAAVYQYFEFINNNQFDALMTLFDENAVLNGPMGAENVTGYENLKAFYVGVLAFAPNHYDDPQEIVIQGNQATVTIHAYVDKSEDEFFLATDHMLFNRSAKIVSIEIIFH